MNDTFIPASISSKRKWYLIDCKDKQLGRLSSLITLILSGKLKPSYHPSIDIGDYVVLVNAEYLTLDREIEKFHVFKPGRPGKSLKKLVNILPEQIIENCILGMMPSRIRRKSCLKRLKIYLHSEHPHTAQNPIKLQSF